MQNTATKNTIKGKKEFFKQGTCSRTFFHILNNEFSQPKEKEEWAIDLLAGGINQLGYQCGMLWGASMAIGAEAYRRFGHTSLGIAKTINSTQKIMASFKQTSGSIDCEDITNTDFSKKWDFAKYLISGKFYNCFRLADKWGQAAVDTAKESLDENVDSNEEELFSCASELLKKMSATQEEILMVSGFAGGLGLSGDGCGALSAAIWKTSFETVKKTNKKLSTADKKTKELLEVFNRETEYQMECSEICRRKFNTLKEHSEFINKGGCKKIINALAETAMSK